MLDIRLLREQLDDVKRASGPGRLRPGRSAGGLRPRCRRRELLADVETHARRAQEGVERHRHDEAPGEAQEKAKAEVRTLGERMAEGREGAGRSRRAVQARDARAAESAARETCRRAPTTARTSSCGKKAPKRAVRLRAAAALGHRRAPRNHRLRARREDLRHALLRAERRRRAASARADHLHARPAHA